MSCYFWQSRDPLEFHKAERSLVGLMLGVEAHCSFPLRTHCPRLVGFEEIWLNINFFSLLLHKLLIERHASPAAFCKAGHAHFFLQNHFLLKMPPHNQGTQNGALQRACLLRAVRKVMGLTSASWQMNGIIVQKAWQESVSHRLNSHSI